MHHIGQWIYPFESWEFFKSLKQWHCVIKCFMGKNIDLSFMCKGQHIVLSNRFSFQNEQSLSWRHPFEGPSPVIIVTTPLLRQIRTILWSTKDKSLPPKRDLEHKERCLTQESTTQRLTTVPPQLQWLNITKYNLFAMMIHHKYIFIISYTCSYSMLSIIIRLLYLLD